MHTQLTRFQAFGIHLGISATILSIFLSIVLFIWYPQPFFSVEGLIHVVWVLIGVDVVLGPTLTLIIFKSGKPGLKRDLSIIAGIQVLFFLYGAHTIYIERPAFAVIYDSDYFDVLPTAEMQPIEQIDPALGYSSLTGPQIVYADIPTDLKELKKILEDMKKGGPAISHRTEYYRPLKGFIQHKYKFSRNLDELQQIAENSDIISKFKAKYGARIDDFAYFPIIGKASSRLLVIDKNKQSLIDYIDINPNKKVTTTN